MLEGQEKRGGGDDEEGGAETPGGEGCAWHIPHPITRSADRSRAKRKTLKGDRDFDQKAGTRFWC